MVLKHFSGSKGHSNKLLTENVRVVTKMASVDISLQIIKCVEKYPILYDPRYDKLKVRQEYWIKAAKELNENGKHILKQQYLPTSKIQGLFQLTH